MLYNPKFLRDIVSSRCYKVEPKAHSYVDINFLLSKVLYICGIQRFRIMNEFNKFLIIKFLIFKLLPLYLTYERIYIILFMIINLLDCI